VRGSTAELVSRCRSAVRVCNVTCASRDAAGRRATVPVTVPVVPVAVVPVAVTADDRQDSRAEPGHQHRRGETTATVLRLAEFATAAETPRAESGGCSESLGGVASVELWTVEQCSLWGMTWQHAVEEGCGVLC
jgi:hypothetical protein